MSVNGHESSSEPVGDAPGSLDVMTDLSPQMLEAGLDPRADIFNRLLRNRVIMLGAPVDDEIANQVCAQLLYLEGEDPNQDIWLYVNSPGGSVTAGMAIYDTMQFVGCDVATVCLGLAASMGQFLLTAGAPGKRYTLPNARIMMHQPLAGLRGQAADIAIQAEQHAYTKRRMAELIAQHSGKPLEQIQADSERDRWFTAEQAVEYGLCDEVKRSRQRDPHRLTRPAFTLRREGEPAAADWHRSSPRRRGRRRSSPAASRGRRPPIAPSAQPARRPAAATPDRPGRPCWPSRS